MVYSLRAMNFATLPEGALLLFTMCYRIASLQRENQSANAVRGVTSICCHNRTTHIYKTCDKKKSVYSRQRKVPLVATAIKL
jgi:hypothetical protein